MLVKEAVQAGEVAICKRMSARTNEKVAVNLAAVRRTSAARGAHGWAQLPNHDRPRPDQFAVWHSERYRRRQLWENSNTWCASPRIRHSVRRHHDWGYS